MSHSFLNNPENEFSKLDLFDKQLFLKILETEPDAINFWILDTTREYLRKGILLNANRFMVETKHFREYILQADRDLNNSLEN